MDGLRGFRPAARIAMALVAITGGAMIAFGARGALAQDGNGQGHTPVTLCHWVPAHGGSFIVITVDDDGANGNKNLMGHMHHENDIIPAPAGGCAAREEETETPEATHTAEATDTPETPGATNTPGANATNTPTTGGQAATSTPTTSGAVSAAVTTETPLAGGAVGGVSTAPSALPSTGSGDGSRTSDALLLAGMGAIVMAASGWWILRRQLR